MNRFVMKKSISPDAKSIHGWIEWVVLADLPVTIVQNEYYVKYSRNTLKPTTYKTVTKYMERLEELTRRDIARELPPTFGLVFDGCSCDGEHYIGAFAVWTRDDGSVSKRLISCGVQDIPESEIASASFGFAW